MTSLFIPPWPPEEITRPATACPFSGCHDQVVPGHALCARHAGMDPADPRPPGICCELCSWGQMYYDAGAR